MNRREYKELLYEEINTYSNYIGIYDAFCNFFWCRQHDFSSCYGTAAGFILTDAGIAILGVTAVVLAGTSMSDLGNLVSRRFALVLSVGVYLLIGPLFALPRT